ncbi:MAG: hypothetical protein ACKVOA_00010 [Methylophilaceae bacterium]
MSDVSRGGKAQDKSQEAILQAQEEILDEEAEKQEAFRESDIQLARVLEDLISMLIDRDFIRFTDFPEPAQKRLIERQGLRMKGTKLNLLDDESLN